MKLFKKLALAAAATVAIIPLCAFINVDIGVDIKDETTVFKEITIDEKKIDTVSDWDIDRIFMDFASSKEWTISDIDRKEEGIHYVGGRMEVQPRQTRFVETYLMIAALTDANYYYDTKTSLGSKTVTVKIKPTNDQAYVAFSEFLGYGKGETDEYHFIIKTPGEIISSNGDVKSNNKTVEWDIKEAVVNGEVKELTVKYKAPETYLFLLLLLIPIGAITIYFMKRRNKITVDDDFSYFPTPDKTESFEDTFFDNNNKTVNPVSEREDLKEKTFMNDAPKEVKIKVCPQCKGPLVDDGKYCERCGMFF